MTDATSTDHTRAYRTSVAGPRLPLAGLLHGALAVCEGDPTDQLTAAPDPPESVAPWGTLRS